MAKFQKLRLILIKILSLSLSLPLPLEARGQSHLQKPLYYKSPKGLYSILQNKNAHTREVSQVILGPQSRSMKLDSNGDGIWDHFEIVNEDTTFTATRPIRGHFSELNYKFRRKQGLLTAQFIYHEKSGSYVLVGKALEPYKHLHAQNVVIGECTKREELQKLVDSWRDIYTKFVSDQNELRKWLFEDEHYHFVDDSCTTGKFKKSYQDMQDGIIQVMAYSLRTDATEDEGIVPVRFLQCMDKHGLGVHADRIRGFLFEKVRPLTASIIHASSEAKEQYNTRKQTPKAPDTNSTTSETMASTSIEVGQTVGAAESSQDAKKVNEIERPWTGSKSTDEKPLIVCEHTPINKNGRAERASWDNYNRQITFNRLSGEQLPVRQPYYSKGTGDKEALLPATKVDENDYAKAFFHELVHSTFIDDEKFTDAIENCCSLPMGFDRSQRACREMQSRMERYSGQQSFIYALNQNNAEAYRDYHTELIQQLGDSVNLANSLEGDVIYHFKSIQDQCDKDGNCNLTLEKHLLELKKQCTSRIATTADKAAEDALCLQNFNDQFTSKMQSIYEEECQRYRSSVFPVNCKDMATKFINVFGDCLPEHNKVKAKNAQIDFIKELLFGTNSFADETRRCDCFDVTLGSHFQDNPNAPRDGYGGGSLTIGDNPSTTNPSAGGWNPEKTGPGSWSFVNPGEATKNNNNSAQRPISSDMLTEMAPVANDKMMKEFTDGYEKRSTIVMDGARKVLETVSREILPVARAETNKDSQFNTSSVGVTESSSTKMVRIADPFAQSTKSEDPNRRPRDSKSLLASNETSQLPTVSQLTSNGSPQNSSTLSNPSSAHGTLAKPSGASLDKSNKSSQSQTPENAPSFAVSNADPKQSSGHNENVSPKNSGSGVSPNPSVVAGKTVGGVDSKIEPRHLASNSAPREAKNSLAPRSFKDVNSLLKFLTGPYLPVTEALGNPDFLKLLIDFKIRVLDHERKSVGARNPKYDLRFNPNSGRLNVAEWN